MPWDWGWINRWRSSPSLSLETRTARSLDTVKLDIRSNVRWPREFSRAAIQDGVGFNQLCVIIHNWWSIFRSPLSRWTFTNMGYDIWKTTARVYALLPPRNNMHLFMLDEEDHQKGKREKGWAQVYFLHKIKEIPYQFTQSSYTKWL